MSIQSILAGLRSAATFRATAPRFVLLLAAASTPGSAMGQDATNQVSAADSGFFSSWLAHVTRIQSEQPHWITPMTTVTPRLEQEYRFDQSWETTSKGSHVTSYGGGKGLELIPCDNVEVILGVPAWQSYNKPAGMDGFADDSFLVKYRIASANEENGNYIATAFLGLGVPTGQHKLTSDNYTVTPTIALGKGWGDFDVQNTLGLSIPDNGTAPGGAGTPLQINTAFQYRLIKVLWPEVEVNYTYWANGEHEGKNQVFLTPGFLLGRFPILNRIGATIGLGYQVALTDKPTFNHNFLLSMRIPF